MRRAILCGSVLKNGKCCKKRMGHFGACEVYQGKRLRCENKILNTEDRIQNQRNQRNQSNGSQSERNERNTRTRENKYAILPNFGEPPSNDNSTILFSPVLKTMTDEISYRLNLQRNLTISKVLQEAKYELNLRLQGPLLKQAEYILNIIGI